MEMGIVVKIHVPIHFLTLPGDTPRFMFPVYIDDITTSATLSDTIISYLTPIYRLFTIFNSAHALVSKKSAVFWKGTVLTRNVFQNSRTGT
jgi:hypothetical protein